MSPADRDDSHPEAAAIDGPHQLDLVSEPPQPRRSASQVPGSAANSQSANTKLTSGKPTSRSFHIHFNCCHVAAHLSMPQAVLEGRSSLWRVHCPRCGRLSEIPVID